MATSTTAAQGRAPHRRHDPGRRDRIIQSCLDVIAARGVAGTSHRAVAAAAGVPLGSMTYHFTGIAELLHEAFASFTRTVIDQFNHRMGAATTVDEARQAVVDLITADLLASQRELILTQELYTLAARDPSYRALTNAWMRSSRAALEQHFDPATARLVDALIEGLTIHRALDTEPQDPALARTAIDRITGS